MKKHKTGFTTFRVTCVAGAMIIVGLVPSIAQTDDKATAKTAVPAPSAQSQTVQAPTLQTPGTQAQSSNGDLLTKPSPPKPLTLAELKPFIPDLAISVSGSGLSDQKATLFGSIPPTTAGKDCQNFNILTSAQGFTVQDKGGFLSCLAQFKADGKACDDTTVCQKLSQASLAQGKAVISCQTTQTITYLDHNSGDPVPGHEWSTTDLSGGTCMSKADMDAVAEKKKEEKAAKAAEQLQQQILSCAKSQDTIEDAASLLQNSSLDAATVDELQKKIDTYQKQFDDNTAKGLIASVNTAVKKGKIDDFDNLEENIYALLAKNPAEGDKMAPLIFSMARARTTADGADDEAIDKAEAMINRALGQGDDPTEEIQMNASNKKILQAAVDKGGGLDQARLQLAYQNYETIRDKKGECQMSYWGCMPVSATANAKKHYMELAKGMTKDMQAELKAAGCVDKKGNETDKASNKECAALEDQATALNDIPAEMEAAHQDDLAKTQQQAASMQASAMSGQQRQYIMGPNGVMMPQQTQTNPMLGQNGMSMLNMNFAPQGAYSQVGAPQYVTSPSAYSPGMVSPYANTGYSGYYMR
jgi:hypothetical protein